MAPALVLIHGDNPPLREATLEDELHKALGVDSALGAHVFQGNETDPQSLVTALTPSLFSESGAVVIQGVEECSATLCEVLLSTVPGALDSEISVFLVGEKGPNQVSKAGKALAKLIKEKGREVACPAPKLHELPRWLEARCKKRFGRAMDADALDLFVERAGTTDYRKVGEILSDLDRELEKIDARLEKGQKVTLAMIEEMVGDRRPVSLQDFLDSLCHRKPSEMVRSLLRLREEGMPGFLLAQTAWTEFVQLFRLRKAMDRGGRAADVAKDLGINAFVFQKRGFEAAAKSRSAERWLADLGALCRIESRDKRGHYQNDWLLELEFYQISR
ncbi:MAG TPA: DNA polymerase III subunit delta [Fibrobacteria bacterium]|nr:DNA polymerase III subunit delta [Fibrobacteria bacterium]HOX52175.1 DNA polymerase III subunit delta [Fibrobacteria bacterium]